MRLRRNAPYWGGSAARALAGLLIASTAGAQRQTPAAPQPLQVGDILSVRSFADRVQVDLSPDGNFLAYTLQDPARAAARDSLGSSNYFSGTGVPRGLRGTDIYVTEILSAQTRSLTQGRGSSWSPAWSPDGRTLAFFSDRDGAVRVWLWHRPTRVFRRLSAEPARSYFGFEGIRWSPDGRRIAVKLSPLGLTRSQLDALLPATAPAVPAPAVRSADGATATVFVATPAGDTVAPPALALNLDSTRSFLNTELADLAMIDATTGRVKRLAQRARVMGWHWAPDGRSIAYTTRQPDGGRGLLVYDRYDLFVVDTTGEPSRLVAPATVQEYGLNFSWSPSGRTLAYTSAGTLHIVAREGGEAQRLVAGARSFQHGYRAPLWQGEGALLAATDDTLFRVSVPGGDATPVAVPDGRRLLDVVLPADAQRVTRPRLAIAVHDAATKLSGFRTIDFANGTYTGKLEEQVALGVDGPYHLDVSSDGQTIAYVAERGDMPPEVWITQELLTHSNRVSNSNSQLTRLGLGATRLIQWEGPRREILRGALLMPGNYEPGKRFPVVVKVYGGSRLSSRLNRFGLEPGIDNLQMLASRGYGVLLPDAPLRVGTPLEDLAATVLPALDTLVSLGFADRERFAVMGHSYGGYSVLALLVQTNRFKAAISSGGMSNLFSSYAALREDGSAIGIGWAERDQGRMGGSPWQYRDRYLENSPFFSLDKVTAPVLLLHGGDDRTVLPARAEETFVALRRLGKTVTLVRYEGEGHHPGSWSLANATDYWRRIIDWLDTHLAASTPRP